MRAVCVGVFARPRGVALTMSKSSATFEVSQLLMSPLKSVVTVPRNCGGAARGDERRRRGAAEEAAGGAHHRIKRRDARGVPVQVAVELIRLVEHGVEARRFRGIPSADVGVEAVGVLELARDARRSGERRRRAVRRSGLRAPSFRTS